MKPTTKALMTVGALWPAYKLFTLSTGLGAAVAAIPVARTIDQLFRMADIHLPPVTSRILSFAVIGGMVVVSWYAAEVVVFMAALAIAGEVSELVKEIRRTHDQRNTTVEEARQRYSRYGAPYFASVEA